MSLAFLELQTNDRELYFREAALRRGIHPAIMEKDFWVCWLLALLFTDPALRQVLVFKGGTSLSKVFGIVQRFSEDIDLSVAPEFLGIAEDDGERATSRTQRDRWMERLQEACAAAIEERVMPWLDREVAEALGASPNGLSWVEFAVDAESHSPIVSFRYPATQTDGFPYVARSVKAEFGSLTGQRPVGSHRITPWVADEFPDTFRDWECDVIALDVERTFWEKATVLHAEYFRPPDIPMPDRYSRHYSDVAAMALHPNSRGALARLDLLEEVATWKARFFASSRARYDLARPGTLRLVPPAGRIPELESDYAAMRDMFMVPPPSLDEVLATLADDERSINDRARG